MNTPHEIPWITASRPRSPLVLDPDPVETAAAVAATMHRLTAETSTLTGLDQAPQIATELLDALNEIANVTTELSRLAFHHNTAAPPTGSGPDAGDMRTRAQAVDGFDVASREVHEARKHLARASDAVARLVDQQAPGPAQPPPGQPGHGTAHAGRTGPRPAGPSQDEATHQPAL